MPAKITRANLAIARAALRGTTRKVTREVRATPQDAWGRVYVVWLDRNNMQPKGLWERQFSENLPIPEKYLRIPEGQPWLVETDLQAWYRDTIRAHEEWEAREMEARRMFYGQQAYSMEPTLESIRHAGEKPIPPELIALASMGDPWCLGFQREPTPAVLAVVEGEPELHERWVLGRVKAASRGSRRDNVMKLPRRVLELVQGRRVEAVARGPQSTAATADDIRATTARASGDDAPAAASAGTSPATPPKPAPLPMPPARGGSRRTAPASVPPVPPEERSEGAEGAEGSAPDPLDPELE